MLSPVACAGDDLSTSHHHRADGHVAERDAALRLAQGPSHEALVGIGGDLAQYRPISRRRSSLIPKWWATSCAIVRAMSARSASSSRTCASIVLRKSVI